MPEWHGWLAALARDERVTRLQMPQATSGLPTERRAAVPVALPTADTEALTEICAAGSKVSDR